MPGISGFVITLVVSTFVLWLAQKMVLPREKEKGIISVLALAIIWSLIEEVLNFIFSLTPFGIIEKIITLILWVWILKVWFKVGWLQAAAISLVAWIIMIFVKVLLGILHIAI
jgi:hypothetical protein